MEYIDNIANIDLIRDAIRDGKDTFFFIPWIGKNYEEKLNGKKLLVVGASHYCNHSNVCIRPYNNKECSNFNSFNRCKLGCDFFHDCTNGNTRNPQIRNYAPNMIQKRKESASLVKRGHSASNVTIKTYKCPLPHHAT